MTGPAWLGLRNGCFHNGPVIYPRLSHNGPRKVVLALGVVFALKYPYWPSNIRIGPQTSVLPPNLTSGICAVVSKKICPVTRKDGAYNRISIKLTRFKILE